MPSIVDFARESDLLKLVDAVHALGLSIGVDEAAECGLEFLSARTVGHASEARAIPVDLTSLGVESTLLASLLL